MERAGAPDPGHYRQTERDGIYREHVERLVANSGQIYPCFARPSNSTPSRGGAAEAAAGCTGARARTRRRRGCEASRRRRAVHARVSVPLPHAFHDILRGEVGFDNDHRELHRLRSEFARDLHLAVGWTTSPWSSATLRGERPHQQHAQSVRHLPRARGDGRVPPHAAAVRPRQEEALQASRRDQAGQLTPRDFLLRGVGNYLCFLSAEFLTEA